ncbi:hypothetical protein HYW58_01130 [Candidatus Kaiserbacteria bacterium]|nr:hypothetical protein [Candidatus Kaiserbacteria bacterium]
MEDKNIHTMLRERFTKLPPKLQEAITSAEVAEKLRVISQKYRLHLDQGQILENETYMILLGIEETEKYEENLKKELGISPKDAGKIAHDVGKEIFLSVRDTLKSLTSSPQVKAPPTGGQAYVEKPIRTEERPETKITGQSKFEHFVKNKQEELSIEPTRRDSSMDPYREPFE